MTNIDPVRHRRGSRSVIVNRADARLARIVLGGLTVISLGACSPGAGPNVESVNADSASAVAASSLPQPSNVGSASTDPAIAPPTVTETGGASVPAGTVPAPPPKVEITDSMAIDETAPGAILDMRLPLTNSASINDLVVSWAAARRLAFARSAEYAIRQAAIAAAQTVPPAPTTAPVDGAGASPAPTTTVVVPPPEPKLVVEADNLDPETVATAIRIRVTEDLGDGPRVSHLAIYQLPNGRVILGSGLIDLEQREPAMNLIRSQVEAPSPDAPGWSGSTWPGAVFGSVLADLQLGADGSLVATIEPGLAAATETVVVRLSAAEAAPLLSAEARWLLGADAPAWVANPPDCLVESCVALTYDDGPSPDTPRLLDVLAHAQVRATFFMIGMSVQKRPEVARAVSEAGHEIGNHTWSHPRLGDVDLSDQQREVFATEYAIIDATGVTPSLLRPPFGVYDDATRSMDFGIALWSVETNDWKTRDPLLTAERALVDTRPGSVVLMHDLHPETVDAAALVIAGLSSDGHRLVTMGGMFGDAVGGTLYYEQGRVEPFVAPAPATVPGSVPAEPGSSAPADSAPAGSVPTGSAPASTGSAPASTVAAATTIAADAVPETSLAEQ